MEFAQYRVEWWIQSTRLWKEMVLGGITLFFIVAGGTAVNTVRRAKLVLSAGVFPNLSTVCVRRFFPVKQERRAPGAFYPKPG
jgi:hypothetical protein